MPLALKPGEQHAWQRCRERYGETLTNVLKTRLVSEIKRALDPPQPRTVWRRGRRFTETVPTLGARRVLGRPSDRRATWSVTLDGREYRVVYDRIDRVIVTLLPPLRPPSGEGA